MQRMTGTETVKIEVSVDQRQSTKAEMEVCFEALGGLPKYLIAATFVEHPE